jgi:hypothetical protein
MGVTTTPSLHPTPNNKQLKPMYKQVELEINHETIAKLDKLAAEQGLTRDELLNNSLQEELNAIESANA